MWIALEFSAENSGNDKFNENYRHRSRLAENRMGRD